MKSDKKLRHMLRDFKYLLTSSYGKGTITKKCKQKQIDVVMFIVYT